MLTITLFTLACISFLFYCVLLGWAVGVVIGRLIGIFIVSFILGLEISYKWGYVDTVKGIGIWRVLWAANKKRGVFQK